MSLIGTDLYILIDINSNFWSQPNVNIALFYQALNQGISSHLAMHCQNRIYIYSYDTHTSKLLFPQNEQDIQKISEYNFKEVFQLFMTRLNNYIQKKAIDSNNYSKIVQALAKSQCKIHKEYMIQTDTAQEQNIEPQYQLNKILIISCSQISNNDLQPLMNCLDNANKSKVTIDVLSFSEIYLQHYAGMKETRKDDLQLISYNTGGVYIEIQKENMSEIVHYFFQLFMADPESCQKLKMPKFSMIPKSEQQDEENGEQGKYLEQLQKIKFTNNCSCHSQSIQNGYLCSVCLTLYCNNHSKQCQNCNNAFDK